MANEEHLVRLQQGVEAWNAWREANRDIKPDLRGAALGMANLRGAGWCPNLGSPSKTERALHVKLGHDLNFSNYISETTLAASRVNRLFPQVAP
jgi:hypothetical protein